eukprot:XP_011620062.1 PREDICTED: eukaryotic translation initiation factor 4 gamma 2-like [Takifugu rubripes]
MSQGIRMDFFLESPFIANRVKLDREALGGLADMFGQMPGSGIGTGPGVIQDRYSPTLGRHRTNPLFNGHGGHIAPPPPSQFDMGPKSFVKSNQVQNQHFLNQNQNHMAQQQVQTKDMPPRFSKKGQINADEVTWRPVSGPRLLLDASCVSCPMIRKKTRYSEDHSKLPVLPLLLPV